MRMPSMKTAVIASLLIALIAMVGSYWFSNNRNALALARNVYWEAIIAKEPELSSRMVAYVTVQRAKANKRIFGGTNIYGVVYKRATKPNGVIVCQFSWTCMAVAHKEPGSKPHWRLSQRIANDELAGNFSPPAHLKGATHYLNPKHSARHNICWFKTHLVLLGKAEESSQHVFYREPRNEQEKSLLPKRKDVPECSGRKQVPVAEKK
jgi:hypothetical protein